MIRFSAKVQNAPSPLAGEGGRRSRPDEGSRAERDGFEHLTKPPPRYLSDEVLLRRLNLQTLKAVSLRSTPIIPRRMRSIRPRHASRDAFPRKRGRMDFARARRGVKNRGPDERR